MDQKQELRKWMKEKRDRISPQERRQKSAKICERLLSAPEYDRFQKILQEEAEKIPEKFYEGLNGGVIISEETKLSPYAQNNDLYIAGQYLHSYQMGKQIVIYYGSMMRLFGYLDDEGMRREIARVLRHELKHHIEGRAGIRSLEKWDEEQIAAYLQRGLCAERKREK